MNQLIPSAQELTILKQVGEMAISSGFLPAGINTAEKAIVIALKGKEIGIPPMQSFSQIAVIQGKPTISAELMLALAYKNVPSAEIIFTQTDDKACVIKARRNQNHEYSTFSFTIEDAGKAGLSGKDNWRKYTAAMLRARAISACARALFADAIAGCSYTPEELGADVNEDGEVIETKQYKHIQKEIKEETEGQKLFAQAVEKANEVHEPQVEVDLSDKIKSFYNVFRNTLDYSEKEVQECWSAVTGKKSTKLFNEKDLAKIEKQMNILIDGNPQLQMS